MIKQTRIVIDHRLLLAFYISALVFGFIAIIFPVFAFRFLGLLIILVAAIMIFLFVSRMYQQFKFQGYVPKQWLMQTGILGLIAFMFILIPASSLQAIVGFLMILGLAGLGIFQLYVAEKKILRKQGRKHYLYGLSSLILAVVVFFNLSQSSEIFMRIVGAVTIYYALLQLYTAIKTKLI